MVYAVLVGETAKRQLRDLDKDVAKQALGAITDLGADPRPHGCTKLKGSKSTYRIRLNTRVGSYRIVYDVDDAGEKVSVTKVRLRDKAYD